MAEQERRQVEYVSVDMLHFDPDNPRLPSRVDKTSDEEVLEYMIRHANVVELMASIGEQGYFPGEPLLAVAESEDAYIVVEGNRRLAAAKLLLQPELAPARRGTVLQVSQDAPKRDELQAGLATIVYNGREDILEYLGYRHITGVETWGPLAKARYLMQLATLKQLESFLPVPDREIDIKLAKEIGSRQDYVGRLLASYAVGEEIAEQDYFDIPGLNEETIDFGTLSTALSYTGLSQFIGMDDPRDRQLRGLDRSNLKSLTEWIFRREEGNTRLGESRNLSKLDAVVESQEALQKFENGLPLEDAFQYSMGPTVVFWNAITDAQRNLELAWERLRLVEDVSDAGISTLKGVIYTARRILVAIEDTNIPEE